MRKLKTCPFCGCIADLTQEDCYGYRDEEWLVYCENCGLQFGFGKAFDKDEAIEAWNNRTNN